MSYGCSCFNGLLCTGIVALRYAGGKHSVTTGFLSIFMSNQRESLQAEKCFFLGTEDQLVSFLIDV
jgi:hypothetical protein